MNESVTIYGNETLTIEDGPDGSFFVLYPFVWGTGYGSIRRVVFAQHADDRWHATVPLMPGIVADADTRDGAKRALADAVKAYLRQRAAFIRDAAPLVERYIAPATQNGSNPKHDRGPYVVPPGVAVWHVIASMGEAAAASGTADDTIIMNPERIATAAARLGIPDEAVRASVAYYLDHKQEIRSQIAADRRDQLDAAFAHLEAESGLADDELAHLLALTADDSV